MIVDELDVYPVGWLAAWQHKTLRREWRTVMYWLRRRDWRAIRNTFNGYLAEPYHMSPGVHRCGSGWTVKRAVARYRREVRRALR